MSNSPPPPPPRLCFRGRTKAADSPAPLARLAPSGKEGCPRSLPRRGRGARLRCCRGGDSRAPRAPSPPAGGREGRREEGARGRGRGGGEAPAHACRRPCPPPGLGWAPRSRCTAAAGREAAPPRSDALSPRWERRTKERRLPPAASPGPSRAVPRGHLLLLRAPPEPGASRRGAAAAVAGQGAGGERGGGAVRGRGALSVVLPPGSQPSPRGDPAARRGRGRPRIRASPAAAAAPGSGATGAARPRGILLRRAQGEEGRRAASSDGASSPGGGCLLARNNGRCAAKAGLCVLGRVGGLG